MMCLFIEVKARQEEIMERCIFLLIAPCRFACEACDRTRAKDVGCTTPFDVPLSFTLVLLLRRVQQVSLALPHELLTTDCSFKF